jgi:hypothetical protein
MRRIRLGWRLAGESFAVLRRDRSLAAFPVLGFAAALLAVLILVTPGIVLAAVTGSEWLLAPFAALAAYAATFAAIYFGVALSAAAYRSLDGHDTTVAEGLAVARERRGLIARWAAVQLVVGLAISALQAAISDSPLGRVVGSVVGGAANVAWGVATFFVVPLLALEGLGPKQALKRSGAIVKERWGEGIAGSVSIGFVIAVVALVPIAVLAAIAAATFDASVVLGSVFVAVAVVVALATAAIATALTTIFRVALLRFATTGEHPSGFAESDLQVAFRPRRRGVVGQPAG